MNKFNLKKILSDCNCIYRFGSDVTLTPNVFNFKSDGNGWWIAIKQIDNSNWRGISISPSTISPLGYVVEYSPMRINRNRFCLTKECCNVSRTAFAFDFQQTRSDFIALVQQIISEDAEYESLMRWINNEQSN